MGRWVIIKTKHEYINALKRAMAIFQAESGTAESDELELLLMLIKDYEDKQIVLPKADLNKGKSPIVRIDNTLEKYKDKVLFKEKLDKANEILKTTGLPKSRKQHG